MCVNIEMEVKFGDGVSRLFCFDNLVSDMGHGFDKTIQGYLLDWDIIVTDEDKFGRAFLDFLEEMNNQGLIIPIKDEGN